MTETSAGWRKSRETTGRSTIYGKESGWRLPPELATAKNRRGFIEKFLKELEERKKAEADREREEPQAPPPRRGHPTPAPPDSQTRLPFPGRAPSGPEPEEAAELREEKPTARPRSIKRPNSRIMKNSDKAFIQAITPR